MTRISTRQLAFWGALASLAVPAACGPSGVVGGECAPYHVDCHGVCVDVESDPFNCGKCERSCDEGEACVNAACGNPAGRGGMSGESGASGVGDSGSSSGGTLAESGASGDPGLGGSSASGGSSAASGFGAAGLGGGVDIGLAGAGGMAAGPGCLPPYDRADACGDCTTECGLPTPHCSPDGIGGYQCVVTCEEPLKECAGKCVDFNIDPRNCGACGHVCPSAICQGGACVGAYDGHVVLACMNYQTPSPGSAQTILLGNAVFLRMRDPVRILAYTEFASAGARANVNLDIGYAASARKANYTIDALTQSSDVSATLDIAKYDVFLIYDQNTAPPGKMASIGADWQSSSVLDSFSAAGGVIIALSGGTTEMDQFLNASGLLPVTAQSVVPTGSKLYKVPSGDAMGSNVISPFAAPADSCTFTTSATQSMTTVFVIEDAALGAGAPVVVHRTIAAP